MFIKLNRLCYVRGLLVCSSSYCRILVVSINVHHKHFIYAPFFHRRCCYFARSLARCLCLLFVSCSVLPLQERFFFSFSFVVAQHPSFYIGRTEKNPKNQNSFSRSILFSGGPNIFFRYVYTSTSIHIYLCMWRVYLEGDRTQINKIFGKSNSSHDIQHTAINE